MTFFWIFSSYRTLTEEKDGRKIEISASWLTELESNIREFYIMPKKEAGRDEGKKEERDKELALYQLSLRDNIKRL